ATRDVVADEGPNDAGLKVILEIDDVMRETQMLRDTLGVVDVVKRTAAVLRRAVAQQLGETALVPELHRQADDGLAPAAQHGGNDVQRKVDVRPRGVAAEAKAEAGARFFGRQANGREDMRRFDGTGRTGRTGGASKTAQIERDDERFAFDTGEGDVGRVWSAGRI